MNTDNQSLLDGYFKYMKKRHQSPRTDIEYSRDLNQFAGWLSSKKKTLVEATKKDVSEYIMTVDVGARMTNRKLAVLKTFYGFLVEMGTLKDTPVVVKMVKVVKNPPTILSEAEVKTLFRTNVFKIEFDNIMSHLALKILYYTGLRVSELANLKDTDITIDPNTETGTGGEIRVVGKGSKIRTVSFPFILSPEIHEYNHIRQTNSLARFPSWLVLYDGQPFTVPKIEYMFKKLRKYTGIKVRPHLFRHTFASVCLDRGVSLVGVKDLLGHANLATTSIYIHPTDSIKKEYGDAFRNG